MKLHIKATAISFLSITIASGLVSLPAFAKDVPSEPVKLYRDGSSELGGIYADSLTGSYAQRIGDLDLGRSAYVRAWERNKDNKDLFDRAIHANIILGNVDEAIAQAKQAKPDMVNEEVKYLLATDALLAGKNKVTKKILDEETLGTLSPQSRAFFARNILAWSLAKEGKKDEAIALSAQSSGMRLLDKNANYSRALIYQYFGDKENATTFYDTAYQSGARSSIGIEAYVNFLAENKQKDKALEILTDLKKTDSQPDLYEKLYKDISEDKITKLKKRSSSDYNKFVGRGLGVIAQISANDFSNGSALSELNIAKKFDQRLYALDVTTARILFALRMQDGAVKSLSNVPFDNLYGEQATRMLAQIEFDKDKEKGLALSQKLLNSNPNISNRVNTAIYYLDTKDFNKAVDLYNSVIADYSPDKGNTGGLELWQLYFGRANAFLGQEDWTKAVADLREANKLNPNNASLLNSLGYTLADQNIDLDEALKLLELAVMINPNSGETIDSLGWVFFRMGKYDEALDRLELAFTLSPDVGEIAEHLGDAYYRTNRKEEAKMEWQKAATLYEKESDKKRASDKVANGLAPLKSTKLANSK